jgi:hypothetical protein
MASVSSVLDHFEGTTPLAVIEALSSTLVSWDPRDCYFQQALMRKLGTWEDPQPFYACMRALDAVMGGLLEEYRDFLQFDKEDRDAGINIPTLVVMAINLIAAEAQRLGR